MRRKLTAVAALAAMAVTLAAVAAAGPVAAKQRVAIQDERGRVVRPDPTDAGSRQARHRHRQLLLLDARATSCATGRPSTSTTPR